MFSEMLFRDGLTKVADTVEVERLRIAYVITAGMHIGSKWKHYKTGGVYKITSFAVDPDTKEARVEYALEGDPENGWSGTLTNFCERLNAPGEGQPLYRFTKV
jgi:hypothetical protein